MHRRHIVVAGLAAFASAAQAARAPLSASYSFRFEWLEGAGGGASAGAHLDLGALSADATALRAGRLVIRRRVAVRIDGPGPTARLSAALLAEPSGCPVRLDGQPLSTTPRVVDAVHRIGTPVVHQIEITVPRDAPPGAFFANLQWLAEPS